MKKHLLTFFVFLVAVASLTACGGAPESATDSTEAAVSRPLTMFVQPGTAQMVSPKGRLLEDPANQTPNLTLVTVLVGTCSSSYSTTAKQAILCVTAAQFNAVNADLAQWSSLGKKTRCDLTYDDAGTNTTKPVTSFVFSTF